MMETTETRTLIIIVRKKRCLNISEVKMLGDGAMSNRLGEGITRRREEWKEHISRMTAEKAIRTLRDNSPTCTCTSSRPHKIWSDSLSGNNRLVALLKEKKKFPFSTLT
jgi:hypothetical protein